MRKLMIIPALLALTAIGCNKSSGKTPGPVDPPGDEWSEEIQQEMEYYLGEIIPFVQLDEDSMYHEWDDEYNAYAIGDCSPDNLVEDYAELLTDWVEDVDEEGETVYLKENVYGETLALYFAWYEATAEYEEGNEIAVYIIGESGGGEEFEGNTIDFTAMGLVNAEQYTTFEGDLFSVYFGDGDNDGKYYESEKGNSIRIYDAGYITILADSEIKSITFTWIKPANKSQIPTSSNSEVSVGTYNYSTHVWTGSNTEVTFTNAIGGPGNFALQTITVAF